MIPRGGPVCLLVLLVAASRLVAAQEINPYPRARIGSECAVRWEFDAPRPEWAAAHDCRVAVEDGLLRIRSTGDDPYLHGPAIAVVGPVEVKLRARGRTAGPGQLFWITRSAGGWEEAKSAHFDLAHDGAWHEYAVPLEVEGTLTRLRLDPGSGPGEFEVDWIEVDRVIWHPLEIESLRAVEPGRLQARIRNRSKRTIGFNVLPDDPFDWGIWSEDPYHLDPGGVLETVVTVQGSAAPSLCEGQGVVVFPTGYPELRRALYALHPESGGDWITRESDGVRLCVARDGSGARVERDGKVLAFIAPLFRPDRLAGPWGPTRVGGPDSTEFRTGGTRVRLDLEHGEVTVAIESERPVDGPVVRVPGDLEQGLFAGLEYLGKGERSSSTLDIETPEHVRFAPDPLKVTMPLMACRTAAGTVAVTWQDLSLTPVFAAPDFFDGSADTRMALRGTRIDATIRVSTGSLEDAILWAVRRRGLPALPASPRDPEAQEKLCLSALEGPLRGAGGWGHCAEPSWGRAPYADHASTLWRLTDRAPDLPALVPGGAHLANDTIWFVTGRAHEWLDRKTAEVRQVLAEERPDGSFHYEGKYRKGHFEDTASGLCAQKAAILLQHAWVTGDPAALEGGRRALEYLKRFRTPRGAQTWELSLHTPDILASAYLVWAHVRGFELTGDRAYLDRARDWAVSGVPFVYLWGRYPTMAYATVPVYGATNWTAPNWMGLPVQWCGIVYAYALALLAPHESSLDWRQLARGILVTGERMQYPDGPRAGCLPDVFFLATQERSGPSINPCALVSLRRVLESEVDSLAVAAGGGHRVAAPFPVTIEGGVARIRARAGVSYQVVVDGRRVVDVRSQGDDTVPLE